MKIRQSRSDFRQRVRASLADENLRISLQNLGRRMDKDRQQRWAETQDINALRRQAQAVRLDGLRHLPELLETLEAKVLARGGHVYWAEDAIAANEYILDVAHQHNVQRIVKSKSMTSEEIGLNRALQDAGLEVLETDLGEYILQLAGQPPTHIVAPAVHLRISDIARLFHEKLGMPETYDIELLTAAARSRLRRQFLRAEMGITGANFAVAETGTLAMITNEGNGRFVNSLPPLHVAIVGVEKVIRSLEDLLLLLQLLPRSATGQTLTSYVSLYNGPARPDDPDGPGEFHLVLLDNGRSRLLADGYGEILTCIRCGACMNACPVYQAIGGEAYGWVYPGPMGSVLTPLLQTEKASELPFASTLCGACRDACPVMIDLPRLLLRLRSQASEAQRLTLERLGFHLWANVATDPGHFHRAQKWGHIASLLLGLGKALRRAPWPLSRWTQMRYFPSVAQESFSHYWVRRQQNGREQSTGNPEGTSSEN